MLQLPPSQSLDRCVASNFFQTFRRRSSVPLACEPPHPSWVSAEAAALFERHAISKVRADPPIAAATDKAILPGPWSYWRLHGRPRIYYSNSQGDTLHAIAFALAPFRTSPLTPWVILHNTAQGFEVANAARLQDILRAAPGHRPRGVAHSPPAATSRERASRAR